MDTKGPEVRTTAIAGGEPIPYQIGDKVKIVGNPAQETTRECIAVSYPGFVSINMAIRLETSRTLVINFSKPSREA